MRFKIFPSTAEASKLRGVPLTVASFCGSPLRPALVHSQNGRHPFDDKSPSLKLSARGGEGRIKTAAAAAQENAAAVRLTLLLNPVNGKESLC